MGLGKKKPQRSCHRRLGRGGNITKVVGRCQEAGGNCLIKQRTSAINTCAGGGGGKKWTVQVSVKEGEGIPNSKPPEKGGAGGTGSGQTVGGGAEGKSAVNGKIWEKRVSLPAADCAMIPGFRSRDRNQQGRGGPRKESRTNGGLGCCLVCGTDRRSESLDNGVWHCRLQGEELFNLQKGKSEFGSRPYKKHLKSWRTK